MLTKKLFILSLTALWLLVAFLPYVLLTPISVNAQTTPSSVNFLYDGGGQRIYKGESGGEHTYYVSPDLEIVVNPDGTTSWRKNYYFNGKQVAVRDNSTGSEQLSYIHQDHLGSTSLVTSEQGTVVSQQVYYPYGSIRLLTTNNQLLITDRQYTGQVSDTDLTGLYYYNARYYSPQIAKFTQADKTDDQINRYLYVNNNPLIYIDKTGNSACLPWEPNCLKNATLEDWKTIKQYYSAIKQNPVAFAVDVIPQILLYSAASAPLGPNAAEAIDTT